MVLAIMMLVGGLAVLILGADLLIRGVTALATRLGVPPIIIGMTVVAFGTSMPEVAVNLISAFGHHTELAFGNVVGSCTLNIGWVLAVTALVRPLKVDAIIIRREIPMMILAASAFMVLSLDTLNGSTVGILPRTDGLILLLLFGVFLYYTTLQTILVRHRDDLVEEAVGEVDRAPILPQWKMTLMILLGLVGVAAGGHFSVRGAVTIAEHFGVPANIIGLTLVSFGTTLPELVTCVLAAKRGQSEIAIGNVVGSNILNILFVGGAVATVHPIDIPPGGIGDLLILLVLCLLLLPISVRAHKTVTRAEGALLLVLYLAYATWRTITSL